MMQRPESTFYIVTPVYNAAQYIDETILSVVTQAGDFSIRYHIQDGGSTDGTLEKIKTWEERLTSPSPWVFCKDVQFSWDSSPDNGMYDAINKGFDRLAPPDDAIMAWVNADDVYMQYAFSTAAKAFKDIPEMEWFGGAVATLFESGAIMTPYHDPFPRAVIQGYCCDGLLWRHVQQNGLFWRAKLWEKAGPLDATLRYAGDFALWPELAKHAELYYSPETLGSFRRREGQLSKSPRYYDEVEKVRSWDMREKALRLFLRGKFGAVNAPFLMLDEAGVFLSTKKKIRFQKKDAAPAWKRVLFMIFSKKMIEKFRKVRDRIRQIVVGPKS